VNIKKIMGYAVIITLLGASSAHSLPIGDGGRNGGVVLPDCNTSSANCVEWRNAVAQGNFQFAGEREPKPTRGASLKNCIKYQQSRYHLTLAAATTLCLDIIN
jgi:hypothetical protein